MEPRDPGYSIFKGAKPEPKIVYELPDGTTTIWLSEYIDAMVEQERERIIKLIEDNLEDIPHEGLSFKGEFKTGYIAKVYSLVELIKGEK
jgi:hypothetical protein